MPVQKLLRSVAFGVGLLACPVWAEDTIVHVMQPGETISQVAFDKLPGSVYQRMTGNLARIRALNPHIKNLNRLMPGDEVLLPVSLTALETPSVERVPASVAAPVSAPAEAKSAPAPQPEPAHSVVTVADPEDPSSSQLGVSLGMEYFRIDAVDRVTKSSASILSQASPRFDAHWLLHIDDSWSTLVNVWARSDKLQSYLGTNKSLDGANGTSLGAEAAVKKAWNEHSVSSVGFGQGDRLFVRAESPQQITLDRIGVTSVFIGHEERFFHFHSIAAGAGVTGFANFGATGSGYSVDGGYGGDARIFLEHRRKSFTIQGQAFYEKLKQNTSLADQTTSTTGLSVGLGWEFTDK